MQKKNVNFWVNLIIRRRGFVIVFSFLTKVTFEHSKLLLFLTRDVFSSIYSFWGNLSSLVYSSWLRVWISPNNSVKRDSFPWINCAWKFLFIRERTERCVTNWEHVVVICFVISLCCQGFAFRCDRLSLGRFNFNLPLALVFSGIDIK